MNETETPTTTDEPTEATPPFQMKRGPGRPPKPRPVEVEDGGSSDEASRPHTSQVTKPVNTVTPEIKQIGRADDKALVDWIRRVCGDATGYRFQVHRLEPDTVRDPRNGQLANAKGHLKTYTEYVTEETIRNAHGGGKFEIRIVDAHGKYITQRTLSVPGAPNIADTLNVDAADLVRKPDGNREADAAGMVIGVLKDELKASREQRSQHVPMPSGASASDIMDAVRMAVDPLQQMIQNLTNQLAAKDALIADLQTRKPDTDPFKESLLTKFVNDDTSRLASMRMAHEAEIRTLKEGFGQQEQRIRDMADRDRQSDQNRFERELNTLKQANDIAMSAVKQTYDTQGTLLREENRRLEKTIDELRLDVKDLRAKKDKTLLESAKEMKDLKEALGVDDEGDDEGTIGKLVGMVTDPDGLTAVGTVIDSIRGRKQAAAQQQVQQQPPPKPQIVRDSATGKEYVFHNGQMHAVKKRPAIAKAAPEGTPPEPPIPQIDPEVVKDIVHKLEMLFYNDMAPEQVAELARADVTPDVMQAIKDLGIDGFLSKVANLPKSSPFMNSQKGRNWIRTLGKTLVGE